MCNAAWESKGLGGEPSTPNVNVTGKADRGAEHIGTV